MTPTCLAADPNPNRPRFDVPEGATDCHVHVIPDPALYPFNPQRSYTPPPAPVDDLKAMHRVLGIERTVIVTPSIYGTDNRATLDAIAGYGSNARGIAVIDETISDRDLEALHEGGIRGLRLNVVTGGGVGLQAFRPLAARIAEMGWHVQLLIDISRDLDGIEARLRDLRVPVIIDHMGNQAVSHGLDDPGFQGLSRLVGNGLCWAKLSGNYRIASDHPHYRDAIPFAKALIDACPDHLVWGTDWPHVSLTQDMTNDGDLLNALDDYAPDGELKRRILVDNPAMLYGFG